MTELRPGKPAPGQSVIIDGNKAAAYGAKLARVDIVSAYPITPQTPLVEYLAQFIASGEMKADMVQVEGEHSALSVLQGAALAGSRVFTGTSGQGLAFMYEPYFWTSTMRLPIVMCIATREMMAPSTVWGGQQDAVSLRDAGWIQLFVEDNQETLDTVIMAYKIAEDREVMLPVNVCYDGFYLSHLVEKVELPAQEMVDAFLPPYSATGLTIDPAKPVSISTVTPGEMLMEYRYKHVQALQRVKQVIKQVDEEFGHVFGRRYGGLMDGYRLDDASLVLVTMGSVTGTARVAVDRAREQGTKVGLLKLRSLRPFPREELCSALSGRSAVGVLDRNVCFGWGSGAVFMETRAALKDAGAAAPVLGFIDGLGGADISIPHILRAIELIQKRAQGQTVDEITWLGIEV